MSVGPTLPIRCWVGAGCLRANEEEDDVTRLFHKADDEAEGEGGGHGRLPTLFGLGPRLDEVTNRVAALPLAEFAAQLLARFFSDQYQAELAAIQLPTSWDAEAICLELLPENSGERMNEPIPDAYYALLNLVSEAVQLLQNAGLVMSGVYKSEQVDGGNRWRGGLILTRRGRAAMADGTVGQILGGT